MGTSRSAVSSLAPVVSMFAISFASAVVVGGACTKALPHGGDDPIWPLRGQHAFVPCEGCHGPGTPHQEPTVCIECHNADRPSPNHHPGENCSPCHTEAGWDVGVGTGDHTGTPPPTHTGTPTPTDPTHDGLPETQLCWDCHAADRKNPTHYADPGDLPHLWWDCAPCHATGLPGTGWLADLYGHPARTPHGTRLHEGDPAAWVVGCSTCHTGGDVQVTDCVTCHATIFPHFGVNAAGDVDAKGRTCTDTCHPTGE